MGNSSVPIQAGFLNPLLRRTASAKNSLRRAPSSLFIEHGKVFQKRKVRLSGKPKLLLDTDYVSIIIIIIIIIIIMKSTSYSSRNLRTTNNNLLFLTEYLC
ncbi:hypothetical protein NQZ68_008798 [Dissostichus eleginoides]|nr:hypothetical protein NQZ68_008798 [Dissostichus eleginoides]